MSENGTDLMDYAGKVCVVTGSASGIGRSVCEMLIAQGAVVYGLDRNEYLPEGMAQFIPTDLADKASIDHAFSLLPARIHCFFGVAGLSVIADSLSAVKYAKVRALRDENGYITGFETTGDFPTYGNDDDRVDSIAQTLLHDVAQDLRSTPTYRNAIHTLSVLTITSNVVYGKKTGATPDGRPAFAPFAPGANPMHNREKNGALASLNSVAKLSYDDCRDGISNTFSIVPQALGKEAHVRAKNLVSIMGGYFANGAHHLNVNVLSREQLVAALRHGERYSFE